MTTVAITTGQESGLDSSQYVQRLRELLGDTPRFADEQASGKGNALRYLWQTVPINDDDYVSVTVGSTPQTVVQTPNPTGSEVYIDFDTGMTIFGTPPPAGINNITFLKRTARWRDSTLLEALMDGARAMAPKLMQRATDSSVTLTNNVWQYTLPDIFNDPGCRLLDVRVQISPSSAIPAFPISGWYLVANNQIQIPRSQMWAGAANLVLEYTAPYSSLSQIEPRAQMLPIWYAAGMLLGFKEATRVRTDTQNVASDAQANPPGAQQNAGSWFMRQFYAALDKMSRPRLSPRMMTTYEES